MATYLARHGRSDADADVAIIDSLANGAMASVEPGNCCEGQHRMPEAGFRRP